MQVASSPSRLKIKLEKLSALALFGLLLFSVLSPIFTGDAAADGEGSGQGNLFRQLVYVGIFAVAVGCAKLVGAPWRSAFVPFSIVLTLVWCTASIGWAINPAVGARRFALTLIVILSIFLLVERSGYERTLRVVRWLLILVLAGNYVAIIGWPNWAIHQAVTETDPSVVGAWRGMLLQKNFAGAACSLVVLFFLLDSREVRSWFKWPVIALATYFLFRTESKTSAALLIISVCFGAASLRYNTRYRNLLLSALGMLVIVLAFMLPSYWDAITAPFSREDALTGRVQIWPPLFQFWREHWLLGSGFGSFWNIGSPEPIAAYTDGWVAQITSGHNGYLDLLVQIGLPGLVIALFAVLIAPVHTILSVAQLNRSRRSLLVALIVFCIGHNLTESSLFDRDAVVHVFLMLTIALLGSEVRSIDKDEHA